MSRIRFRSLILGAALISAAALAQPASLNETATTAESAGPLGKFAGSIVSYTHSATAYTFVPTAQGPLGYYDPTWQHQLTLMPEWHPTDWLYLRGRLFLAQEITDSDVYNSAHEVALSDTSLEVGTSGWKEPTTGVRVGGYLRLTAPTSKTSLAQTRVLGVAPALRLSRSFDVLSGLSVSYTGRFSWRFNRTQTGVTDFTPLLACQGHTCSDFIDERTTGKMNAWADIVHGPTVIFQPTPKVSVNAVFYWVYTPQFTPTADTGHADSLALQAQDKAGSTYTGAFTSFDLSGTWQVTKPVALSFGLSTFSPQVGTGGYYIFPLVNRDTTIYLDATFDIDATVNAFL